MWTKPQCNVDLNKCSNKLHKKGDNTLTCGPGGPGGPRMRFDKSDPPDKTSLLSITSCTSSTGIAGAYVVTGVIDISIYKKRYRCGVYWSTHVHV